MDKGETMTNSKPRVAQHPATGKIHALRTGQDYAECNHNLYIPDGGGPLELLASSAASAAPRVLLCRNQGCAQVWERLGLGPTRGRR